MKMGVFWDVALCSLVDTDHAMASMFLKGIFVKTKDRGHCFGTRWNSSDLPPNNLTGSPPPSKGEEWSEPIWWVPESTSAQRWSRENESCPCMESNPFSPTRDTVTILTELHCTGILF